MKPLLGFVALAAAGFLVLVLLAKPDYGRPPRLAAVVDGGKMEEFLETAEERETILRWVNDGAPGARLATSRKRVRRSLHDVPPLRRFL